MVFRSTTRYFSPPESIEDDITRAYLTDLTRTLNDRDVHQPDLPINRDAFPVTVSARKSDHCSSNSCR